jgi:hypothetical protein
MLKRNIATILTAALLVLTAQFSSPVQAATPLQDAIAKLAPEQQAKLKAYETARAGFTRRTDTYWRQVELKRRKRKAKIAAGGSLTEADYVNEQPPVYKGPARPDDIMALLPKPPKPPAEHREPIPVVSDFLRNAEAVYGFTPERVSEDDFMIYYAMEAIKLGLTRDEVVRVYALETGGMGTHDLQSGYNPKTGRAASTALGYAQLLAANTIEQLRKDGLEFAARLERQAEEGSISGTKSSSLRAKAAILRRMIADALKVRENWPAHVAYAKTEKGLGMHAINLDGDIGPWLQVVKLRGIKEFAARKGLANLTGAQLELMNLSGPAHGFEMMQPVGRTMPTSNFFERRGYERNPIAAGKTGAQLLAKIDEIMDRNVQRSGAQRFARIFDGIANKLAAAHRLQSSRAAP